jgi:DNA-binding IclR family transcriptional regulator
MDVYKPQSVNQSVFSAFEIINYLTGKGWCRVKDIAGGLNMEVAKVHRLLKTMTLLDYIQYDEETRRYQLGLKFYSISYHMLKSNPLISASRDDMEWAASQLYETINLGILTPDCTDMVHIYRLDGNAEAVRVDSPLGASRPAQSCGLGKCMLAFRPLGEQQSIAKRIDFVKYTENTIDSIDALLEELSRIRAQGYAVDDGEFDLQLYCIAKPIFSKSGTVEAAISVSALRPCSEEQIRQFIEVIGEASMRTSRNLGYQNTVA